MLAMAGYVIARIDIVNPEIYQQYIARTPKSIADHGGRFIVRGGHYETMEGDDDQRRLVVIEFPSFDDAKRWYDSPEYQEIKKLRLASAKSELLIARGADEE